MTSLSAPSVEGPSAPAPSGIHSVARLEADESYTLSDVRAVLQTVIETVDKRSSMPAKGLSPVPAVSPVGRSEATCVDSPTPPAAVSYPRVAKRSHPSDRARSKSRSPLRKGVRLDTSGLEPETEGEDSEGSDSNASFVTVLDPPSDCLSPDPSPIGFVSPMAYDSATLLSPLVTPGLPCPAQAGLPFLTVPVADEAAEEFSILNRFMSVNSPFVGDDSSGIDA